MLSAARFCGCVETVILELCRRTARPESHDVCGYRRQRRRRSSCAPGADRQRRSRRFCLSAARVSCGSVRRQRRQPRARKCWATAAHWICDVREKDTSRRHVSTSEFGVVVLSTTAKPCTGALTLATMSISRHSGFQFSSVAPPSSRGRRPCAAHTDEVSASSGSVVVAETRT